MENAVCSRQYVHRADLVLKQVEAIESANLRRRRASFQIDTCLPQLDDILDSYLVSMLATSESTLSPSCKVSLPLADELSSDEDVSVDLNPKRRGRSRKRRTVSEESYEAEIIRLRDVIRQCFRAVISIDTNADLKVQRLQLELENLRKELADERAENSKIMILNESLQKRYQAVVEGKTVPEEIATLHRRELTVEKHVNSLLSARNNYASENHVLKQMILNTCPSCRRDLGLNRRSGMIRETCLSPKAEFGYRETSVKKPTTPTNRPTWQSNAQKLIQEEIPKSLERKVPLSHPTRTAYRSGNFAQGSPRRATNIAKESNTPCESNYLLSQMTKAQEFRPEFVTPKNGVGDLTYADSCGMISGVNCSQPRIQRKDFDSSKDDTRTSTSPEFFIRTPDDTHLREMCTLAITNPAVHSPTSTAPFSLTSSVSKLSTRAARAQNNQGYNAPYGALVNKQAKQAVLSPYIKGCELDSFSVKLHRSDDSESSVSPDRGKDRWHAFRAANANH